MKYLFLQKLQVPPHQKTYLLNYLRSLNQHIISWTTFALYIVLLNASSFSFFIFGKLLQIIFVENKKLRSTLLDDIDESQLPDVYGGKLSLVPIQDT